MGREESEKKGKERARKGVKRDAFDVVSGDRWRRKRGGWDRGKGRSKYLVRGFGALLCILLASISKVTEPPEEVALKANRTAFFFFHT